MKYVNWRVGIAIPSLEEEDELQRGTIDDDRRAETEFKSIMRGRKVKMRCGACYARYLSNCHVNGPDTLGFSSLGLTHLPISTIAGSNVMGFLGPQP